MTDTHHEKPHVPSPSLWPIGFAIGLACTLVGLIVRAQTRRPLPHAPGETRYWLTFWFADGTTLGRPYYLESSELMGGVVVGGEFTRLLEGHLAKIAPRASP